VKQPNIEDARRKAERPAPERLLSQIVTAIVVSRRTGKLSCRADLDHIEYLTRGRRQPCSGEPEWLLGPEQNAIWVAGTSAGHDTR